MRDRAQTEQVIIQTGAEVSISSLFSFYLYFLSRDCRHWKSLCAAKMNRYVIDAFPVLDKDINFILFVCQFPLEINVTLYKFEYSSLGLYLPRQLLLMDVFPFL